MLATVIRIGVIALALWVATVLVPGIELGAGSTVSRIGTLLAVALVFGVVNAVLSTGVTCGSTPQTRGVAIASGLSG